MCYTALASIVWSDLSQLMMSPLSARVRHATLLQVGGQPPPGPGPLVTLNHRLVLGYWLQKYFIRIDQSEDRIVSIDQSKDSIVSIDQSEDRIVSIDQSEASISPGTDSLRCEECPGLP